MHVIARLLVFAASLGLLVSGREIHGQVSMGKDVDVNAKAKMSHYTKEDELEADRKKYKDEMSSAYDREQARAAAEQDKLEGLKENSELWQERRGNKTIIYIAAAVGVLFLVILLLCIRRCQNKKKARQDRENLIRGTQST